MIIKVISEAPRPMNTDICRMLPEIESIVVKSMEKSPDDRYQTADEMRRALTDFVDSSRAQLSAIDASAGATVMLPVAGSKVKSASAKAASTSQDFIPTMVGSKAPAQSIAYSETPSQSQSQSQSQAQCNRNRSHSRSHRRSGGGPAAPRRPPLSAPSS